METPIGRQLTESRARTTAAGLAATLIVGTDFWLVHRGDLSYSGLRAGLALLGPLIYLTLARGDLASVGLRLYPAPGLRYWLRATLAIGAAIAVCLLAGGGFCLLLGRPIPLNTTEPAFFWRGFRHGCILAPAVEEAIYRIGFCCGAVALFRAGGAIAASGILFGALHVLYGNPGPDNLVAGFFLAWAFLKSGSIVVPMALHALGNLCALASWIGLWVWWYAK